MKQYNTLQAGWSAEVPENKQTKVKRIEFLMSPKGDTVDVKAFIDQPGYEQSFDFQLPAAPKPGDFSFLKSVFQALPFREVGKPDQEDVLTAKTLDFAEWMLLPSRKPLVKPVLDTDK